MCSGAIYWSGIGRMVFGCSNETLSRLSGDNLQINSREILERGTRKVEVVGPILESEAKKCHETFWKSPKSWWRDGLLEE
jgi:tRNA(Arg) A34 adenosine deaminase TadA